MSGELKPCPFCGGNNIGETYVETYSVDSSYNIFGCKDCGVNFHDGDGGADEWNKRARPPVVAETEPVSSVGLLKRLVDAEPYLTDKVHYTCDSSGDYRTYHLELYIPTPAAAPEPFEIAAAKWIGTAPPASGAVPAEVVGYQVGDQLYVHRDDAIRDSVFHSDHRDVFPLVRQSASGAVPDPMPILKRLFAAETRKRREMASADYRIQAMTDYDKALDELRALLAKGVVS